MQDEPDRRILASRLRDSRHDGRGPEVAAHGIDGYRDVPGVWV
jgi:hypothetical protein